MKKQEIVVTARTVEQAIAEGAGKLSAPEEAVEFEVLQEPKKGFLGIGEQPAKVRVWYTPDKADAAEDFLRFLLEEMEIDAKLMLAGKEEGAANFRIEGENAGLLIGYHGETLDALQYITGLIANRAGEADGKEKSEYLRVTVDAGGYREKRQETLRALAKRTAARVRRTGRSVTLEPMNPNDRRVIHSAIQAEEGVSTESVGTEGHRCVVVFPEGQTPGSDPDRSFGRGRYADSGYSRRGDRPSYRRRRDAGER